MLVVLLAARLASAHSGGTDANGCHAGSRPYHCHKARGASSVQVVTRAVSGAARPHELNVPLRAVCVDGTVSYSANPAGTCAHHGGVAAWFDGRDHADRALVDRRGVEGPPNASFFDGRWACRPGYVAAAGACVLAPPPEGARPSADGRGWVCDRGFAQVGEGCVAVQVPAHAALTPDGAGWACLRGFVRSGAQCLPVAVPPNGRLTVRGDAWECAEGYARASEGCVREASR